MKTTFTIIFIIVTASQMLSSQDIIFERNYNITLNFEEDNNEYFNIGTVFRNYFNSSFIITQDGDYLIMFETTYQIKNVNNEISDMAFPSILKINSNGDLIFHQKCETGFHSFSSRLEAIAENYKLLASSCLKGSLSSGSYYSCSPAIFVLDKEGNIIEKKYIDNEDYYYDTPYVRYYLENDFINLVHGPYYEDKIFNIVYDNIKYDNYELINRYFLIDENLKEIFGKDPIWGGEWQYLNENKIIVTGTITNFGDLQKRQNYIIVYNFDGTIELIEHRTGDDFINGFSTIYLLTDKQIFINYGVKQLVFNKETFQLVDEFTSERFGYPFNSTMEYEQTDDGGFIFLIKYRKEGVDYLDILRTDSNFEEFWRKEIDLDNQTPYGTIKKINNNEYAIIYNYFYNNNTEEYETMLKLIVIKDNTVNVSENNYIDNFYIYPNPSSDILHINTTALITNTELTDILGRTVFKQSGNVEQISTAGLAPGLYLLKLYTAGGEVVTEKVVVR